jgi:putative DNA primase/helicase
MSAAEWARLPEIDIRKQFEDALRERDIIPPAELFADGKLRRCDAVGRGGRNDAAYLLHDDAFPAGGFENHRDGLGWENWKADLGREPTPSERNDLRVKAEATRAERQADDARRKAEAAARAEAIWGEIQRCAEHPYLRRKSVQARGVRVSRGKLVVPVRDNDGRLCSLQFIAEDGSKKFLSGGRIKGCYYTIGEPAEMICIAEGFATGATVHEATGYAVAVAFDCGNLRPVAEVIRAKFPAARIVIAADDDYRTVGNPGITKARDAAAAVGGLVAVPDFGPNRPETATDFNDLARLAGSDAVRAAIEKALIMPREGSQRVHAEIDNAGFSWAEPDLAVLRLNRRPPPLLPITALGVDWARWVVAAAEAAACPADYVVAPLLASISALIGNARWAQATPGWSEPRIYGLVRLATAAQVSRPAATF